jgi:integrase
LEPLGVCVDPDTNIQSSINMPRPKANEPAADVLSEALNWKYDTEGPKKRNAKRTEYYKAIVSFVQTETNQDTIIKVWDRIREWIRTKSGYVVNSQSQKFSDMRTILKDRFGSDSRAYKHAKRFGMSIEEYNDRNNTMRARQKDKAENVVSYPFEQLPKVLDRIVKMKEYTVSGNLTGSPKALRNSIIYKIIGIILAIGLRQTETIVSTIMPSNDTEVVVSGLLKHKGENAVQTRTVFHITTDQLMRMVRYVQSYGRIVFKGLSERQITTHLNNMERSVNAMNKLFGDTFVVQAGGKTHIARKLYASALYRQLEPAVRSKINEVQFISNVLGHKSITATMSYVNVVAAEKGEKAQYVAPREKTASELARVEAIKNDVQDKQIARLNAVKADKRTTGKLEKRVRKLEK